MKNTMNFLFLFFLLSSCFVAYAEDEETVNLDSPTPESVKQSLPAGLVAAPSLIEGRFSGLIMAGTLNRKDIYASRPRIDLSMKKEAHGSSLFLDIRGQILQDERDADTEVYLREAYVSLKKESGNHLFIFNAGKKIFSWGKLDEYRLYDYANTQDLRLLILDERADRKIGSTSVGGEYWFGSVGFQAYFSPAPKMHILPLQKGNAGITSDFVNTTPLAYSGSEAPSPVLKHSEYSARLVFPLPKTDIEILYYNGYYKLPTLAPANLLALGGGKFMARGYKDVYPRVRIIGASFETSVLPWGLGLRGEIAYTSGKYYSSKNFAGGEPPKPKDETSYGIGIDKSDIGLDGLYVNIQYINTLMMESLSGLQRTEKSLRTITTKLNYAFTDYFKSENSLMYVLPYHDVLLRPELSWQATPETKYFLGYLYVASNKNESPIIYQYRDADSIYFRLDYYF